MSSTATGQRAEAVAAAYLELHGFEIIARNWKTPSCEIDIVARESGTVVFVEVKFRSNDIAGSGLEYITRGKLKQMQRAADTWMFENKWTGECRLAAIEVGGSNFAVTDFFDPVF